MRMLLRKREERPEDNLRMPSRVIVADNHPLFRAALASLLREHSGLEVVAEAADGRETLECCRRLKPDLVVMDVRMPEVDGLEATRAIKQELPHTVVLVLNGYGAPDTLMDALEAGAAGYILKSATPQQISEAIQKVLEGSSLVDPEIATQLLLRLLDKPRNEPPSALAPKRPPGGEHAAGALPVALAPREVEVLRLIARGYTNRQIAQSLLVSVSTVKKHVQRIITKLGVSDRTQAAVKANNMGLLDDRGQE
jgi:DNA-binding NarL/FixJ family response regulator